MAYKETGSFKFWCHKVLPLIYDDSLSYYELLCKVVNHLNDVINNVDELHTDYVKLNTEFTTLKNYVDTYFDNLDVQDEINKKLDSLVDDGTLSQLLSELLSKLFLNNINANRLFSYTDTNGAQFIAYTGATFLIFNDITTNVHMTELTLDGHFLSESTLNVAFHPNGGFYKDGKIYITASGTNLIYVIDYITKSVDKTIEVVGDYTVIGACIYDNVGYISTHSPNGQYIYRLEGEDLTRLGECSYTKNYYPYPTVVQTFCIYDGSIYLAFNQPNSMLKFNLANFKLEGKIILDEGNGLYPYGELECPFVFNNQLCFISILYASGGVRTTFTTQLFITDINNDKLMPSTPREGSMWKHDIVYVDSSSVDTNPNGTEEHPFKSLSEACIFYTYNAKHNNNVIGLVLNGNFDESIQLNNCNCAISGSFGNVNSINLYNVNGSVRALNIVGTKLSEILGCNIKLQSITGSGNMNITDSVASLYYVAQNINANNSFIDGHRYVINSGAHVFTTNNTFAQTGLSFNKTNVGTFNVPYQIQKMLSESIPMRVSIPLSLVDGSILAQASCELSLSVSECNNISGGSSLVRHCTVPVAYNNMNVIFSIEVTISASEISMKTISATNIASPSTALNPTIYVGVFTVSV